ncbi:MULTISPECIES: LysR family transcriptional regulator [unclassified Rhizobacter]|uniref:LysR family transcriptional regulator n=1 Tax=unclassified Rhizobacter TaxID=2640088 RepID=UPI0006FA160E|nr:MULTISPECIES: LysR family transcriptional regulator [unclassified Rhizobacter]KQU81090.1 LysR family transcriptional regulator [Rhizobacter sp. Root29]KQW04634.1 LysR family transcriptional regulator [Rhizobacter sp. Root1238]KRB06473.1 LysR family transcriptional regulator [Rhizobacter sp. Root16D2]
MDKLRAMEVFVAAVDTGSFAAAAELLDLSAVMVGKHIRTLEKQLGARLLERTTRRHALTEIGAAYLDRCRDVLAGVHAADGVAESLRSVPQGVLRVTAPVAYGAHKLTPVIGDYIATYPQVQVDLHLNDRVIDIVEEGFDCGIRSGAAVDERLIARPLALARMFAVASPGWVARHGQPKHPSELEAFALLSFAAWGSSHSWRFTRDGQTVHVPVRGPLTTNNGQALLASAMAGVGVIVQSDALLDFALASGQVVQLLPDWELPTRQVHIVRLPEPRPSAKIRTFVDFVAERLGQHPASERANF